MNTRALKNFLKLFPECYFVLLHDKGKSKPVRLGNKLDIQRAKRNNNIGYGVFLTPNGHKKGWKAENLTKINSWFIDIDKGTKEKQLARIKNSPIKPSVIVETKRGFHVYWLAKDATEDNFANIQNSLVDYFHADNNTKSIDKLLRVPYFNHNKTYKPFMVKIIRSNRQLIYTEQAIMEAFKAMEIEIAILVVITNKNEATAHERVLKHKSALHRDLASAFPDVFSSNIRKEDSMRHLETVSGSSFVNNETYSFKSNRDGTYQIIVNGKSSSCWIRKDGSIGSPTCGGPSIIQWIQWFKR